jgi:argonaute-like protein implicated in RNA metabolism and viral defense
LLQEQLQNYTNLNNTLTESLDLKNIQISEYQKIDSERKSQIDTLNKELKNKNKVIKYLKVGGITVSIGLILVLLLK